MRVLDQKNRYPLDSAAVDDTVATTLGGQRVMGSTVSRMRQESGATLVEFALLMPLLLLMIIGITEFGIGFKDWLTVANSTREGARMGAVVGNNIDADCKIIGATMNHINIAGVNNVQEFWVFKANSDGSPGASKNTYSYLGGDPADCMNWSGVIGWDSTTRNTTVGSTPLDILGIRLTFQHDWITGLPPFTGSLTWTEDTIMRLEPEAFE